MIHKDKQNKWFSNDTSQTESVWLRDEPKMLADYDRLMESESILAEAERIVNGDR